MTYPTTAGETPQPCPHCSGGGTQVYHQGACPKIKGIEYHPNGTIKKIEYKD